MREMADGEQFPQQLSVSPMHTLAVILRLHIGTGSELKSTQFIRKPRRNRENLGFAFDTGSREMTKILL
jgi:hypothetical protein